MADTELLGQHRYQLDAKGRIALPARFHEPFAEGVYLTLGLDGCLWAFPRGEWERESEEVHRSPLTDRDARAYARMFFANAERTDLDAQGRLVIPQRLRAQVGLEREVAVVGVSDRLEIWPTRAWDLYEQSQVGGYTAGTLKPPR